MTRYHVIEIDSPKAFEIVRALDPTYAELDYEDAHEGFLILNYPTVGSHTLVQPEHLFDSRLELGVKIKTFTLIKD